MPLPINDSSPVSNKLMSHSLNISISSYSRILLKDPFWISMVVWVICSVPVEVFVAVRCGFGRMTSRRN